ncbi:MAG: NADH:ubiquinone reductase (Na(+)-transporting) subunit C [Cryomorphaceae bacterium]|jgi:Na+-transporting NADH:ubiquinone oxidoreductase subunit C|nr:NADH:ubiquinone reductase (Na(+)-transporting) subunit C [Cryomorphaceae bacterium]|tara:strand:+ start:21437 stop:22165 length:729 start_codon:yes stop_codon:yes gene_type:complete
MNINSNSYTYFFAIAMVIVVASLLSIAATSLKPFQEKNIELEKKSDILSSIGVIGEDPELLFDEYITDQLVIQNGLVVSSEITAFDIDLEEAVKESNSSRKVPLFKAQKNGDTFYVIPMRGTGLWGPIWGYVSLKGDGNTILGASFDHEKETPGLGAEISTPIFEDQFPDKILFSSLRDGIEVRKGDASGYQQVDGISGGTITSVGVQTMFEDCLIPYKSFLLNLSIENDNPSDSTISVIYH